MFIIFASLLRCLPLLRLLPRSLGTRFLKHAPLSVLHCAEVQTEINHFLYFIVYSCHSSLPSSASSSSSAIASLSLLFITFTCTRSLTCLLVQGVTILAAAITAIVITPANANSNSIRTTPNYGARAEWLRLWRAPSSDVLMTSY